MVTTYLANIPSPDRGVWELGPIPIRAYALCIIVGILVAIWWGERRWIARGGKKGEVTDIAVFAVPFGLIGGRLYHVATDHQQYFGPDKNPWNAFAIWNGGLGIWGAIALGAIGAWIACRRKGIKLSAIADAVAPGIVTAQAIGRLGNYFNQELYGGTTTLPWGLEIYRRVIPGTTIPDELNGVAENNVPVEIVHPTFLYEMLWNLGVVVLLIWAERKYQLRYGRVFALYVAGYTAGRFWIELMRTDPATLVWGVRINVITSVVVFVGAVLYLVLAGRKTQSGPIQLYRKPTPDSSPAENPLNEPADEPLAEDTQSSSDPQSTTTEVGRHRVTEHPTDATDSARTPTTKVDRTE